MQTANFSVHFVSNVFDAAEGECYSILRIDKAGSSFRAAIKSEETITSDGSEISEELDNALRSLSRYLMEWHGITKEIDQLNPKNF